MPFCPRCRSEYRRGIGRCPDCLLALVSELPDGLAAPEGRPGQDGSADEVLLCLVTGEIHAKLLQDALASQGIPSRTRFAAPYEGVTGILRPPPPYGSPFNAVVRVLVRRRDLPRAMVVYDDLERRGIAATGPDSSPDESDIGDE
jgi:pentatricopeptide repeat protein